MQQNFASYSKQNLYLYPLNVLNVGFTVIFSLWLSRVVLSIWKVYNRSYSLQSFSFYQLIISSNQLTKKMSQYNKISLENLYANLSLEEEDEGGVVVGI